MAGEDTDDGVGGELVQLEPMSHGNIDVSSLSKSEVDPAAFAVESEAVDSSLLNEDELFTFPMAVVGAGFPSCYAEHPEEALRNERQCCELGNPKFSSSVRVGEQLSGNRPLP